MENNSNAIAEIQKKYAGCNLLMPAATEVQLNPFYKITVMEVTADRKSTRLNSSHYQQSRMPSSA